MDKDGGIFIPCKTRQHNNNKKSNYCYVQAMWMKKKLEQNNTYCIHMKFKNRQNNLGG